MYAIRSYYVAFYGAYVWVALAAIAGTITLGQMTMYLLVFKQGQSAVTAMLGSIGGMYEDNLYLSNLYGFLEEMGLRVIAQWSGDGTIAEMENTPKAKLNLLHCYRSMNYISRHVITSYSIHYTKLYEST